MGVILSVVLFSIAIGKIKRISAWAGKLVPSMVIFYFVITGILLASLMILIRHLPYIIPQMVQHLLLLV